MESCDGWGIQLLKERDERKVHYRYEDPSFSINNMPLNEMEINQLKSAIDILSHFKGMPQFEWVHELVPKLKQGISSRENSEPILEFDNNQYLKGIEWLGVLFNAISYQKVLSIGYQPFEIDNPFEVILHPYYLKQYNNRWFLFGYNPANGKYDWNLAIDRIASIQERQDRYKVNNQINWQEHFDDIVGVTKPEDADAQDIVLHFFGKTGKYMETKPIHGSQKTKRIDENTLEVKLNLIINYEFERLILSYADSVQVIEPQTFAEGIRKRMSIALQLYSSQT